MPPCKLPDTDIEIVHDVKERGLIRYAIFDFDGTISTFREGWQRVMHDLMMEYLLPTPDCEEEGELDHIVNETIEFTTGKQTIYQMIALRDMVAERNGQVEDPFTYKEVFNDRLLATIHHRIEGVRSGKIHREDMLVPGSVNLLEALRSRGVVCFLASGTDDAYVKQEAATLGVDHYFQEIHGARDDYQNFSKRIVIESIIRDNQLNGVELVGFGDGFVEIEDVAHVGGIAVGVASDEVNRCGVNAWKRNRLIEAGADIIVPDYRECDVLMQWLFQENQ